VQIEWTRGALLFYGGIAGMGLILLVSIVVILVLRKSKARLTKKLDAEYGRGNEK
jgi:hypothetical protein